MGMGGGDVGRSLMAAVILTVLVFPGGGDATTYFVGGRFNGWGDTVAYWGLDRLFKAGDKLVFEYERGTQNVLRVDEVEDYFSCFNGSRYGPIYASGLDTVTLEKGFNYFFSGLPGQCQGGGLGVKITAYGKF